MKRQLKSSLKPIRIVFIEEAAFNAVGPLREFFWLYFDAAARNIMRGTSSSFTLLHDVKKLNNGDFEKFGLLIALAIIYGCPGPRNMQESLLCSLLDLPIDDGNIEDIQILIVKPNYKNCQVVLMKIHFKMFWMNSLKDMQWVLIHLFFISLLKDNAIKNIIHHCCISSCLEEIRSVQKGMSTLGVSIVLFFSVS